MTRRYGTGDGKRLLIVEDDSDVNGVLKRLFDNAGYAVDLAGDGEDAQRLILERPYDLYLFDIMLPGQLDGEDLLKLVRRTDPAVPVLIMTGRDGVELAESGAAAVFTKPLEIRSLLAAVDHALQTVRLKNDLEDMRRINEQSVRLLTSISAILICLDERNRILQWNATAEQTFGLKARDVVKRLLDECAIPWQTQTVSSAIVSCRHRKQRVLVDNVRFTRPDGTDGYVGITLNPMLADDGSAVGVVILGKDVTEQRVVESQLSQAQKLESIGQLAAGIAHEINTPIQYVGDNTRFLKDSFTGLRHVLETYVAACRKAKRDGWDSTEWDRLEKMVAEMDVAYLLEEVPKAIDQTLDGVDRVAKIVRAMKKFSHPGVEEKTALDVNQAIESTITVSRNEWKYVADMELDLDPALPVVNCYPGEFNQVILNMVVNAAHAIAERFGSRPERKGVIRISTRPDGDAAEISIADNGNGIPEKARPRIFDPFFTTKEVGKGTGQGLAISHDVIVKKHGGTIRFETETGVGTTFIVKIPFGNAEPTQ